MTTVRDAKSVLPQVGDVRSKDVKTAAKAAGAAMQRSKRAANEDVDAIAAGGSKKEPLNVLDKLDVTPPATKVRLPKGILINSDQDGEASDPFNLFQEGMDPANENPLRVENGGKLEISVGGFAYADGERDGPNYTTITPLSYLGEFEQRYHLVNTYNDKPAYELLFNFGGERGRVWMREYEKGKWSTWQQVCDYVG